MSDSGEKKYDASQKKLQDQRKKGQVAQSQDIGKLLGLTLISEIALSTAQSSMLRLEQLLMLPVSLIGQPFVRALQEVVVQSFHLFLGFALLMTGGVIVMKLISSWLQFGFLFAPETLVPDLNRLNPISQAKQMFSAQSLMNLLMGVIKALLIGFVLYRVVNPALGPLILLVNSDLPGYIDALIVLFRHLLHVCLGVLLVLALFDLALQRYFFAKRMRMSYVDVVKEYKDMEGDPYIKMLRRSLAHEQAQEAPAARQPPLEEADVLLINPTHFAVALYYRPLQTSLPVLIDKGADAQAREMIARARAAEVPIVQSVWLTRTLYRAGIGDCISRETLQAVALIYRTLRELDADARRETIELSSLESR
ncbi:type III secretion system export apparatus subunit SctU [Pseudomonas sp.]|uniref:type III secretion system export apparatus subunit SctU n=1 Tax=Pseudomonas sp. TaxID=306 RepID=UPI0026301E57|nr:type III secretion system export apparatus subunit SctU [Pseudomonas sp.]